MRFVVAVAFAAALLPPVVEARPKQSARPNALTITGAMLLSASVVGLASGAMFHVRARRSLDQFGATFEQNGATGFPTITWQQALEYRRRAERLGTAAAISYGFVFLALPVGAVLVATGVTRSRRAHVAPLLSRNIAGLSLGGSF